MGRHSLSNLSNADYISILHQQWLEDPSSVDSQWDAFFKGYEFGREIGAVSKDIPHDLIAKQSRVDSLIYAYRDVGYLSAHLDPLNQTLACSLELSISEFGLSEEDLDKRFSGGHFHGLQNATLRKIIDACSETYCRTIGVEYLHIQDKEIRRWLQSRMEPNRNRPQMGNDKKILILEKLIEAEEFEKFLHTHYIGQKRFSLEGSETLIPALHAISEYAPEVGIDEIEMGMSHRGRLNVLANILDKSIIEIFSEFEDNFLPETYGGDGDVKYHKGYRTDHMNHTGKKCGISLASNPSHLEIVGSVVQGKASAKQRRLFDTEKRTKVLPLIIHGDAAFSGQGIVSELFNLSQLRGYSTGGTIHIVVNNQIGFTTSPRDARSSCFPTDIAKMVNIPIFHINADDPEAVVYIVELAVDFRQRFGRDIVIDLFCFRRHGHNEGDEPSFTQPHLYKMIKDHPGTKAIYALSLIENQIIDQKLIQDLEKTIKKSFERGFNMVRNHTDSSQSGMSSPVNNEQRIIPMNMPVETGVDQNSLLKLAESISSIPEKFAVHPKLKTIINRRLKRLKENNEIDWAFAEALALGSLLVQNIPVRLSGQDSGRGTFSQRHSVWWDVNTSSSYVPLQHLHVEQASFYVYDSPLSEPSVLGFEYGYSLADPQMLIMWEAQFGDFANGAQVIIDQFIVSSESKWQKSSGIVLLLPHGFEGQGPEHSTAHLERFLQLCAENNIQVCNATTPAQYFHLLRRQMFQNLRKPLVIMTPKSLLRHPLVISSLDDIKVGLFKEVLPDPDGLEGTHKLILCSGKVFYDLLQYRREHDISNVALIRLEQLYPFPETVLGEVLKPYDPVNDIYWVQEEPKNRGAWSYIAPRLSELWGQKNVRYIGRKASASPATGSLKRHRREQDTIIQTVFGDKNK